jgi:hypothetical protein
MTQIGVGIGVTKSPTKTLVDKQNHINRKTDSATGDDYDDEDPQNLLAHSVLNTQNSSNSSDQRRIGGGDDDNSNSFESHSDYDLSHPNEKKTRASHNTNEKTSREKTRRGMSVNWGSSSTTGMNASSTLTNTTRRLRPNRGQINQKQGSNVKFFATSMAQSLYRNPIRLSGLSSASKPKGTNSTTNKNSPNQQQAPGILTTIPEPEHPINRVNPPPQPRPESLAIMSDELFHEKLRARQSPSITGSAINPSTSLNVNTQLTNNFPSTSSFLLDKHCIEDVTYSTTNQFLSTSLQPTEAVEIKETKINLIELPKEEEKEVEQPKQPSQENVSSFIQPIKNIDSSDESWRLLNSNSSLDEHIPYIDETDFEDLGKILINYFLNNNRQFIFS